MKNKNVDRIINEAIRNVVNEQRQKLDTNDRDAFFSYYLGETYGFTRPALEGEYKVSYMLKKDPQDKSGIRKELLELDKLMKTYKKKCERLGNIMQDKLIKKYQSNDGTW